MINHRLCCPTEYDTMDHAAWCQNSTAFARQNMKIMDEAAWLIAGAHFAVRPRNWEKDAKRWLDKYRKLIGYEP